MNSITKSVAGTVVSLLAVGAALTLRSRHGHEESVKTAPQVASQEQVAAIPPAPQAVRVPEEPVVIPPLPADAVSVPDADLLKLSAMVNLPNAEERRIDKEPWTRALPIASQLVQGPCDCEQRNWLNHFIELGNNALAGSEDAYYSLAALMHKMARNDRQLAEDPGRIVR